MKSSSDTIDGLSASQFVDILSLVVKTHEEFNRPFTKTFLTLKCCLQKMTNDTNFNADTARQLTVADFSTDVLILELKQIPFVAGLYARAIRELKK